MRPYTNCLDCPNRILISENTNRIVLCRILKSESSRFQNMLISEESDMNVLRKNCEMPKCCPLKNN